MKRKRDYAYREKEGTSVGGRLTTFFKIKQGANVERKT